MNIIKLFAIKTAQIIPPLSPEGSYLSTTLPVFYIIWHFNFCQSDGYKWVSHLFLFHLIVCLASYKWQV